jgi:dihydrofolate synthase/folylpolyglutamate synthase
MEIMGDTPRIVLDGAHNPAGAAALAQSLREIPRKRLLMVVGVMSNKDVEGVLAPLLPLADRILAVTPGMPRSLPSHELAELCGAVGGGAEDTGSVANGIDRARREAAPEDLVVVCGSLFVVGEARAFLLSKKFEPCRG